MSHVPAALVRQVVERAGDRCEYCGLAQLGQEARFHVDHVIPLASQGPTTIENLALACVSCSLRKGDRLTATDPDTQTEVPVFNPRAQRWADHFRWDAVTVIGLTPSGRATIVALDMNRPIIQAIREEEAARGRHPPV
jgi:HNH endonuclease